MKGLLIQLKKSAKSGLRTPGVPIRVTFQRPPIKGERFECFGQGLKFGTRWISTSGAGRVLQKKSIPPRWEFSTESGSEYLLELTEA